MAATSTSHYLYDAVPLWSGTIGTGGVPDGTVTTIPLSSGSGLIDGNAYIFTIDRVDANGNKTPSKREVCRGVLSGNNFINCIRGVEGTAQAHSAGAVVEILFTAHHWDKLIEGWEVEHNQDGTHNTTYVVTPTGTQTLTNKTLDSPLFQGTVDGWVSANETWTYASSTTFTISGDQTGKYQKGDKIRLKQGGGYKYFYITNVSYSSPNTTVTITGGSDYSLTDATITDNYYSKIENPQGFPQWFNYSVSWQGNTGTNPSIGNGTLIGKFKLDQAYCFYHVKLIGGSTTTWGSGGSVYRISFPIEVLSTDDIAGMGWVVQNKSPYGQLAIIHLSNTWLQFQGVGSANYVYATQPFTFGAGDSINIKGFYTY